MSKFVPVYLLHSLMNSILVFYACNPLFAMSVSLSFSFSSSSSSPLRDEHSFRPCRDCEVMIVDVAHSTQAPATNGVIGEVDGEVEA